MTFQIMQLMKHFTAYEEDPEVKLLIMKVLQAYYEVICFFYR